MGRFSRFGETDTFSQTLRFAALLRWASGSLKQDVSVAVEAVKQDGTALQVVSEVCSDGCVVSAFFGSFRGGIPGSSRKNNSCNWILKDHWQVLFPGDPQPHDLKGGKEKV